jgi:DNA-binding MarR family transcriptional regulator
MNRAVKRRSKMATEPQVVPGWTFLSNHTHVMVCLAGNEDLTLRDIALTVGITERAVHRIVSELEEAGALTRERIGRRNVYRIHPELHLRHPLESHCTIGEILKLLTKKRR